MLKVNGGAKAKTLFSPLAEVLLVAEVRQAEVVANRDCRQSKSPLNEVLLAICFKLAVYG